MGKDFSAQKFLCAKATACVNASLHKNLLEARGEVRKLAGLGWGGNRKAGTTRSSRNAATVSRGFLELLQVTNGCKSQTVPILMLMRLLTRTMKETDDDEVMVIGMS